MPSVYDFRHVELDKVGRGKRVIKAPGGGSSIIFESGSQQQQQAAQQNGNGAYSETDSVDGSVLSCPSTPVHNGNGNGSSAASAFGYESDTSSNPSSAASSRRGSLAETKNRLFGQPEAVTESPRRRVVDRMKSNIFAEPVEAAPIVRTPSVKKYEHVVNRNPITGEVIAAAPATNGTNGQVANGNGAVNGVNGSASMPNTPVRVRQPPGGKSSNIFG